MAERGICRCAAGRKLDAIRTYTQKSPLWHNGLFRNGASFFLGWLQRREVLIGRRLQEDPEGIEADGRPNREVEQAQEADDDGQGSMTFFLDVTLFIRLDALYHYSFRRE